MGSERVTVPPQGRKMTICVDVEGVGQLLRLDVDSDRVACIAPGDRNDYRGGMVSHDAAGRPQAIAGFEIIMRDTGRPVVVVDAFGAAPALWGKIDDVDAPPLALDVDNVEALSDRLTVEERADVDDVRRVVRIASGGAAGKLLRILDRIAPPPPPATPRPAAVVEAAERAALGVSRACGLGGVPGAAGDALDGLIAHGLPQLPAQLPAVPLTADEQARQLRRRPPQGAD